MLRNFLCGLALFLAFAGGAQTVTVRDADSGEPIEAATLGSDAPKAFTTTDAHGRADIRAFRGAALIEIRSLGHQSLQLSFAELERQDFKISLKPSVKGLDQVVVSATRSGLPSRNSPSRIAVIRPSDVALANPQTAADMLGASGEVFIQKSQQGGGSPMIRGFSANRLLYAVDGVRMNTAIFRAGNLQNVISLDPLATEQAEVLFGPGSILYGSDAIGGVMSFQTLTPRLSDSGKTRVGGKAVARYTSANQAFTGHADINLGWKRWASVTSLTYSRFGDLRMGRYGPDDYLKPFTVQRVAGADQVTANPDPRVQNPSGYDQVNLMQKLRFAPNARWDFQYAFHWSETSEYGRYDRLIETQANGLPVSAVWNYGPQIWGMHQLSVTHSAPNNAYDRAVLRVARQYFEESRIDRKFNGFRLRTNLDQVRAWSANLDLEKRIGRNRLYYGAEYVLNDVASTGKATDIRDGSPIAVPARYPASLWTSAAAYVLGQRDLGKKLMLQAGARYGGFGLESDFSDLLAFYPFGFERSTLRDGSFTGSLGLVWKPQEAWDIRLNAGTGYRAPNVDDTGKLFDFAAGEVVVPNPGLSAEYAYNAELAVARTFGEFLRLEAAVFHTFLDRAMVRRPYQVNGQDSILFDGTMSRVFAIQNAAYGTVSGFQAGLELILPAGFRLASRFNFQSGREETDNGELSPSRHAAPAFGSTRLTWHGKRLLLQGFVEHQAAVRFADLNPEERTKPALYAKDADGNPWAPAWYTLNLRARYRLNDALSFSATAENLTDRRYRPYSSGLSAPGRNFHLSVVGEF